jgi:hypothetical protein
MVVVQLFVRAIRGVVCATLLPVSDHGIGERAVRKAILAF